MASANSKTCLSLIIGHYLSFSLSAVLIIMQMSIHDGLPTVCVWQLMVYPLAEAQTVLIS